MKVDDIIRKPGFEREAKLGRWESEGEGEGEQRDRGKRVLIQTDREGKSWEGWVRGEE